MEYPCLDAREEPRALAHDSSACSSLWLAIIQSVNMYSPAARSRARTLKASSKGHSSIATPCNARIVYRRLRSIHCQNTVGSSIAVWSVYISPNSSCNTSRNCFFVTFSMIRTGMRRVLTRLAQAKRNLLVLPAVPRLAPQVDQSIQGGHQRVRSLA